MSAIPFMTIALTKFTFKKGTQKKKKKDNPENNNAMAVFTMKTTKFALQKEQFEGKA